MNSRIQNNADRGAERALFFRRTYKLIGTLMSLSIYIFSERQKNRRTEKFSQNAERRRTGGQAKVERSGGLVPVSDMM
jgi:hypothetical protein